MRLPTRASRWKTPLEDEGHSTPVIGGDLIWFTAATTDGKKQFVYCIDRTDGKIVHHKLLFENPEARRNSAIRSTTTPRPRACWRRMRSTSLRHLRHRAARSRRPREVVWQRRDINVRHFRGPGSSPVLFENLIILTFDGIERAVHHRARQEDRQGRVEARRAPPTTATSTRTASPPATATCERPTARRTSSR